MSSITDSLKKILASKHLSITARIALYTRCQTFLEDDIPLYTAFQEMRRIAVQAKRRKTTKQLDEWLALMKKGQNLNTVWSGYLPEDELAVIRAAERSGALIECFKVLCDIAESKARVKSKIIATFSKPIGFYICCCLIVVFFSVKVYPVFEKVIDMNEWPLITRLLYGFGQFLMSPISLIGYFVMLLVVVFMVWHVSMTSILFRDKVENIFPYNFYGRVVSSFYLTGLSTLLIAKVPMLDSVETMNQGTQGWVKNKGEKIYYNLKQGLESHLVLDIGMFNRETLSDLSLYLNRGDMGTSFAKVAKRDIERLEKYLDNIAELSTILTTLMLGVIVSLIYYSVFSLSLLIS